MLAAGLNGRLEQQPAVDVDAPAVGCAVFRRQPRRRRDQRLPDVHETTFCSRRPAQERRVANHDVRLTGAHDGAALGRGAGRVVRHHADGSSSYRCASRSRAEAPRPVSSVASPTQPEWAVSRGSTPAARGGRGEPFADGLGREANNMVGRLDVAAPFSQRTDGAGDVALDEAHVGRFAVGVRLAAADGDEQAVVASRVGDVPPLEGRGPRAEPGRPSRRSPPGSRPCTARPARGRAPPAEAGQHAARWLARLDPDRPRAWRAAAPRRPPSTRSRTRGPPRTARRGQEM